MSSMDVKQRSSGYVNPKYYEEKEKLECKRRKGFCMLCQKSLKRRQRKYHKSCFNKWYKQFNPPYLWNEIREKVFKRDRFSCKNCGKTEEQLEEWYKNAMKYHFRKIIADHIIPIALGGEEFKLKNIQTLCVDCNAVKTHEDMKKIAELRVKIKQKNKMATDIRDLSKFKEVLGEKE